MADNAFMTDPNERQRDSGGMPQFDVNMGMQQGPRNQQQGPNYGYNAGNLSQYLSQNAMTPTGQYNPQPYGLPSWSGFSQAPVGQYGSSQGQIPSGMWDFGDINSWQDEETRGAMKSYLENQFFPGETMRANNMQNAFTNWLATQNLGSQQAMNAFNMGQTGRQTGLQEWAAQEAARQQQAQFGLDTQLAQWRYGQGGLEQQNMANQRTIQGLINSGQLSVQQARDLAEGQRLQQSINSIGFGRETLGEQARASKAQEALRATQLQNELMAARYAALGRARAPQAQWQANWG